MKKLLLTGFDPFGGETVNPAWEAVQRMPDRVGDYEIFRLMVPTVFGLAGETVISEAERLHPDVVLAIGQAGGRSAVTPELAAINHRYARIPDNAGQVFYDEPCVKGAPNAYFSSLPVRAMAEAITASGLPGAVSYSAGAFVCNDLFYALARHFDGSSVRVGFIHVPFLPEQAKNGAPSLPLADIVRALTAAVEAIK